MTTANSITCPVCETPAHPDNYIVRCCSNCITYFQVDNNGKVEFAETHIDRQYLVQWDVDQDNKRYTKITRYAGGKVYKFDYWIPFQVNLNKMKMIGVFE